MKVAIVDSWFHWPPVGGAIRSVKEIGNGLSRRGMDVTVVAPLNEVKGGEDFRFAIRALKIRKMSGPVFYSAIRRALREISPDVVFVTSGNLLKPYMILAADGFPTLVRLYAYELRCPSSFGILYREGHVCEHNFVKQPFSCMACPEDVRRMVHNTSIIDRPESYQSLKLLYPLYHALVKRTIPRISAAIATSNYMKQKFEGVIPLDRIEVLADGVDSKFFSPSGENSRNQVKIITLPGRTFDPLKGLDVLLRAATLLWEKRQDFRVVVTGSGRPDIGRFPFIARDDWLDDKDIPGMYGRSNIVVVPSVWGEPLGLTALEAMSCEVPVIASRAGGLQETVREGENGLFFEPGNHEQLAQKIEVLLDDEELGRRMGREGRKYVVKNFAWPDIMDRYAAILERVRASHPTRAVNP
jgi:glycosyltransferase involved in cell wall biosynthesis